jgi:predicted  nucleic acid-binding Zn-ribbon protein
MAGRAKSPLKGKWGGVKKQLGSDAFASPIDREQVSGQMQDIFSTVKKLRDEKDGLVAQLEQMAAQAETQNKRLTKELLKARRDVENLSEMFAAATEGVNAKSAYRIPEVPEAAVAALVPSSLHAVIEERGAPDVESTGNITIDGEVSTTSQCVAACGDEYAKFAEAGKNLVWDVERLNMIIQAYDKDLHKLKNDGGLMKSRVNALRLMWRAKFSSLRRWQDFTRRSHVERFQEQLDEAQEQFEAIQSEKKEDLDALWSLIGAQKIKENKVKLTLFLKKMRMSKVYVVWRAWQKFMAIRRQEQMEGDKDAFFNEHNLRMHKMKKEEVEALLRTFLKRMANMKLMRPFTSWLDLVGGRKGRSAKDAAELERQKRLAAMADLEASETAKRLKMHFARLNGRFKDMCFNGWKKFYQVQKMANLGEDERFKRLKVFLEAKLKGVKYATFKALHREYIDLRKAQMLNNERAKKVGTYLEMIARGITARQFGAFKRFQFIMKAEREEEARLAALIAERDSQSLQRLKVFLQGKEKRQLYGMFSWWSNCTFNSKGKILQKELEKAQKARMEAEAACEALRKAMGADAQMADAQKALADAQARLKEIQAEQDLLQADIDAEKRKIKELEEKIAAEKEGRKADKAAREKLAEQLKTVQEDKKSLEGELALIVDQIGFLSEYSTKKK